MRVALYLGRHFGAGGGIGVYASTLVQALLQALAEEQHAEDEVVIYGDRTVLNAGFLETVKDYAVPAAVCTATLQRDAGAVFKQTKDGKRIRVLIRMLPASLGRYTHMVADQLLVPLLVYRDKPDLLHSVANYALLAARVPQIATVHDLFQAFPGEEEELRGGVSKAATRLIYRFLFASQFRMLDTVITDTPATANEIKARYRVAAEQIRTIPPGLDDYFAAASAEERSSSASPEWLQKMGLRAGYVLLLASSEPRKNLKRALQAWRSLSSSLKEPGLVLKLCDNRARNIAETELNQAAEKGNIVFLDWLSRADLVELYRHAGVLLFPSLGEGFGYPALEALAVGCPVVCSDLPCFTDEERGLDHVFICDGREAGSISGALSCALLPSPGAQRKGRRMPATHEAVKELLELYRERSSSRREAGNG